MAKIDSTIATIAVAFVAAAAVSAMLTWQPNPGQAGAPVTTGSTASPDVDAAAASKSILAASATGRIEPKDGQLRIMAPIGGEIAEVLVKANDRMLMNDLLVRLDDEDQIARIAAAESEAEVRRRERDDESKLTGVALDRRKAADAVETAERELFKARQVFDAAMTVRKTTSSPATELVNLRQTVVDKEKALYDARAQLASVAARGDMPLPDRLESALTQARSDLRLAYQALERTRVRAPSAGTVLHVGAKVGELAGPGGEQPLLAFGDLSTLKVRAEVEERDVNKVRVGQRVVVRSDAYPGKDFSGRVTQIASALGAPHIVTRGPRRPNDVDVLEVVATLDAGSELLTGMRVDVFFANPETASGEKR